MINRREFLAALAATMGATVLLPGCAQVVCVGNQCYTVTVLWGATAESGDTPSSLFRRTNSGTAEEGSVGWMQSDQLGNGGPNHIFSGGEEVTFFELELLTSVRAEGDESFADMFWEGWHQLPENQRSNANAVVYRGGESIPIEGSADWDQPAQTGDILMMFNPDTTIG